MSPIGDGEFDAYRRHVPPPRKVCNCEQWATIAVEAEDIMQAIAVEAKARQGKRTDLTSDKKLSEVPKQEHANSTPTKAAELFNTNRTYVNQAAKPHF